MKNEKYISNLTKLISDIFVWKFERGMKMILRGHLV
jgi:hypothetical protein